jgi:hypothetical protein
MLILILHGLGKYKQQKWFSVNIKSLHGEHQIKIIVYFVFIDMKVVLSHVLLLHYICSCVI